MVTGRPAEFTYFPFFTSPFIHNITPYCKGLLLLAIKIKYSTIFFLLFADIHLQNCCCHFYCHLTYLTMPPVLLKI